MPPCRRTAARIVSIASSTPLAAGVDRTPHRAAIGRTRPPAPFDAGMIDAEIEAIDHQQAADGQQPARHAMRAQCSADDKDREQPSAAPRRSRGCAAPGRACRECSRRCARSRAPSRRSRPWRTARKRAVSVRWRPASAFTVAVIDLPSVQFVARSASFRPCRCPKTAAQSWATCIRWATLYQIAYLTVT